MSLPAETAVPAGEPSPGGGAGIEPESYSPSDLLSLASAQQRLADRLSQELRLAPEEIELQRRLIRFLRAEARERASPAARECREHFYWASSQADLFALNTHPSHRRGAVGQTVTLTKRAILRGLKPFHLELLRPQRAFNLELIRVLAQVFAVAPINNPTLAEWASKRLRPLVDPAAFAVKSHRSRFIGRATESAKRRWLGMIGPAIAPVLERQRAWNEVVIEAVVLATGWNADPDQPHDVLGGLKEYARPVDLAALSSFTRASQPLWIDLFRRQEAFNAAIERALSACFQLPFRGDDGGTDAYAAWIALREAEDIAEAARRAGKLERRPLISLVTPTYESPETALRAMLDSVLAQSYDQWELCVADDGSSSPHVRRVLEEYAAHDPRIRVKYLSRNGGIAAASNAALQMTRGAWVGFLDHDDALPPHALAEVALWLDAHPETDVVYSDEDRLDLRDRRCQPFFKPDWSPDLLRACNYLCHFTVARRSLLQSIGGFRVGFDGSQDYDLILRLSERTVRIGHISKVLYHWRLTPYSTAQDPNNKPAATLAGMRALREHLQRSGCDCEVDDPIPTNYRVRYRIAGRPRVSIVCAGGTPRCVDALLRRTAYENFELLLVGGKPWGDDRVRTIEWSDAVDAAAMRESGSSHATGEYLVFLEDCLEVVDGRWLDELLGHCMQPPIGAVAPKVLHPDGCIAEMGLAFHGSSIVRPFADMADGGEWTTLGNPSWTRNWSAVSSYCFMVRRQVLDQVGGLGIPFSELAFGQRLTARGLRVVCTPHTRLVRFRGSRRRARAAGPVVAFGDPFLNPNVGVAPCNGRLAEVKRESTDSSRPRPGAGLVNR